MASMVRLNRIYTKTGDDGSTGLADGSRVSKHDPRIESYGTVDELNSLLGLAARCGQQEPALASVLARIQNDLFDLGADLATPGEEGLRITHGQVVALERDIDQLNADLQPLESFVLPGGSELSAWLHVARTVCRRAERSIVMLTGETSLNPQVLPYVNRLSDLLFVMARWANGRGQDDVLWVPGKNR